LNRTELRVALLEPDAVAVDGAVGALLVPSLAVVEAGNGDDRGPVVRPDEDRDLLAPGLEGGVLVPRDLNHFNGRRAPRPRCGGEPSRSPPWRRRRRRGGAGGP